MAKSQNYSAVIKHKLCCLKNSPGRWIIYRYPAIPGFSAGLQVYDGRFHVPDASNII